MVSIIIPVYKVELYLRRCVDSVLAQTYKDLEIILVDDGSPDNCGRICDEYARIDNRVKVIHQENRGLSGARNAGLDIATGQYIAFLDSDDYVDPSMYEKLLTALQQFDGDIAECGYRWIKPNVTYDYCNTGKVDVYTNTEALDALYFGNQLFGGISIVVWNKLYKAEIIGNNRFLQGLINEDVEFTPRVLYTAKRIIKLNRNLYNFFFSANSISRSSFSLKNLDSIVVREKTMLFHKQHGFQRYYNFVESTYYAAMYSCYFECYRRRRVTEYAKKASELENLIKQKYLDIIKNPYHKEHLLRHHVFHISPKCWYACMLVVRWIKRMKIECLGETKCPKSA